MNVAKAIYDALAADTDVTDLIGEYQGNPSIFTSIPVPGDAVLPYITISGPVANTNFDCKDVNGTEEFWDIGVYVAETGSVAAVDALARIVKQALHRKALVIDGGTNIICSASGPVTASEFDEAEGRVITLRVVNQED